MPLAVSRPRLHVDPTGSVHALQCVAYRIDEVSGIILAPCRGRRRGSLPKHEHRSRAGNYMFGTKVNININVWNLRRTAALKWPWIITMDTIRPDDPPEPLSEHPRGVDPQRSAFCRTRVQSGCFQEIAQS